jgi:hypothetical protein
MKNQNFLIPIHLILFSFGLLTSCKGQEKPAAQPAREAIPALLDFSEPIKALLALEHQFPGSPMGW